MMPPEHFIGRWLRAKSHLEFGHGYCKGKRGDLFILSYADVPRVAEQEILVDPNDLIDKPIPVGSRVWVPGTPYGWHAGVITTAASAQRYRVSLVGMPKQFLLYQDQFYMRWSQPLEEPVTAVCHGLSETPTFYEARSAVLAELVRQRQVSRGLSCVLSAPVNLYHHQIDTVARVLADPVMRYLLADEVGLGKTIEAGLVIRQLLIDDPYAKVLVLCPESLFGQWSSELRERLSLGLMLDSGSLMILSHEDVTHHWNLDHFSLVVIDEAHNLLGRIAQGSATEVALTRVPALLALSASPMRGDVDTFRKLLSLVDPVAFSSMSADSFRQRLEERERSASDLQVLASRRASVRQKARVVVSLQEAFPDDVNVQDLARASLATEGANDRPWHELADYVRETYRLSRRMIRHRRNGELTDGYSVAGRRPTFVEIADPARALVDEFLELFRLCLGEAVDHQLFNQAVLHSLAGPGALHAFLLSRLSLPCGHPKAPAAEERSLFDSTISRLELAGVTTRLAAAMDVVRDRVEQGLKVVVCSSFGGTATEFEDRARDVFGEFRVFGHLTSMPAATRDDAVAAFLSDGGGVILVADRSMEEGRNLQEAHVLVNLDLPLDASRLDQRIGRLDRYAVRPDPAEIVVLTESESVWVTGHVRFLAEGTGVFESSVSTVQRLLTEVLHKLLANLVPKGADAFHVDTEQMRAELDIEREDIDLLEELESVNSATVFSDGAFADLVEYEEDERKLRSSVKRLTSGTGALALKPLESTDGVVKFGGAQTIGLPEDEVPAVRDLLSTPKTYSRDIAVGRNGIAPFRIGDPLVDWLEKYLRTDERGRAFAMVRPLANISTPALWLHSEFLVEFDRRHLSVADGAGDSRFARRGEALFPPVKIETWTDPSGQAPETLVNEVLDLPFDTKRDEVLRGRIWNGVLEAFPAWTHLCQESANVARDLIEKRSALTTGVDAAVERANSEISTRLSILRARSLRLPTAREREAAQIELDLERMVGQSLVAGIRTPSVRMVACGACLLWPEENF